MITGSKRALAVWSKCTCPAGPKGPCPGLCIVALEPAGLGFDFFTVAQEEILGEANEVPLTVVRKEMRDLSAAEDGQFGFVFSIHALEHVGELDESFARMVDVVGPRGTMVHLCPNYLVPYDPHFGIPLLPGWPAATRFLLPSRIRNDPLWRSINFIDGRWIRRAGRLHHFHVWFAPGLTAQSIARVSHDHHFAERHNSPVIRRILALIRASGLEWALWHLPAVLASPMLVVFTRDR